jgi:hypothetical protein
VATGSWTSLRLILLALIGLLPLFGLEAIDARQQALAGARAACAVTA